MTQTTYKPSAPPIKNAPGGFTFYTSLVSVADTDNFKSGPTLTAGDVKISIDGAGFGDLTNLPTASGGLVTIVLTQAEINGNTLIISFVDVVGDEWQGQLIIIQTVAAVTVSDFDDTSDTVIVADPLLNSVPGSYVSGTAGHALGRIGSGQITTVSPVAQDGDVETYQGAAYKAADGLSLDWTDSNAAWPTLTDCTIKMHIGNLEFTGSVVVAAGAGKKVRLELTGDQSATISLGKFDFWITATQADADILPPLVTGKWTSKRWS